MSKRDVEFYLVDILKFNNSMVDYDSYFFSYLIIWWVITHPTKSRI